LLPFEITHNPEVARHPKEVEYEPSVEAVFNYLVPKYVEVNVFGAIVESATCEHAARRMAMESATDNAREMLDDLSLFYNRARQAAITDEIIEIVAGAEAQK
jgi:F-type H+-transporting ATPase subunit gamma